MAVIRTSALTQQAEEQLGHPVDLVSCFAAAQEWYVRRTDRNMLIADVPGHWSNYHLQVTWQDYNETLRLDCGLELPVDDGAFQRLALVICLLNQHLFLGHFVIAPDTGAVELSYKLPLRGQAAQHLNRLKMLLISCLASVNRRFRPCFMRSKMRARRHALPSLS